MTGTLPSPFVTGVKQTRRAISSGKAAKLYVARDADPALTEPLISAAGDAGIPVETVPAMRELGQMCGIAVGAACAAALA